MTNWTTKMLMGAAALVVATGVASAQTMTADIPFAFQAGGHVLAPGAYTINLDLATSPPVLAVRNRTTWDAVIVLPTVREEESAKTPRRAARLVFMCRADRCALTDVFSGTPGQNYQFLPPRGWTNGDSYAKVIPLRQANGE